MYIQLSMYIIMLFIVYFRLQELNAISRIRLDRANIGKIDSFELLGPKVTNLYLQVVNSTDSRIRLL